MDRCLLHAPSGDGARTPDTPWPDGTGTWFLAHAQSLSRTGLAAAAFAFVCRSSPQRPDCSWFFPSVSVDGKGPSDGVVASGSLHGRAPSALCWLRAVPRPRGPWRQGESRWGRGLLSPSRAAPEALPAGRPLSTLSSDTARRALRRGACQGSMPAPSSSLLPGEPSPKAWPRPRVGPAGPGLLPSQGPASSQEPSSGLDCLRGARPCAARGCAPPARGLGPSREGGRLPTRRPGNGTARCPSPLSRQATSHLRLVREQMEEDGHQRFPNAAE